MTKMLFLNLKYIYLVSCLWNVLKYSLTSLYFYIFVDSIILGSFNKHSLNIFDIENLNFVFWMLYKSISYFKVITSFFH